MRKNLTPIGNSLGIILDRSILSLLKLDENTAFDITTDGRRLILEPVADEGERGAALLQTATGTHGPSKKLMDSAIRRKGSR